MTITVLKTNWVRVILCGLVTGVIWFLLSVVALTFFGQALIEALQHLQPYPRQNGFFFFGIDLLMGIWALWVYSSIRARYSSTITTAISVGFAWWLIKSLQSAKWAGLGLVTLNAALAPLVATLPATMLATIVGTWLYEHKRDPNILSNQ